MIANMTLSEKGLQFQKYVRLSNKLGHFGDLSNMIALTLSLDEIKIKDGYVLKGEKLGGDLGWYINLYTEREADASEVGELTLPELPPDYRFSHRNNQSFFENLRVPFTEMGIFQAVVLWNAWSQLPMYWHSLYDARIYLYEKNLVESILNMDAESSSRQTVDYGYCDKLEQVRNYLHGRVEELKGFPADFLNPLVKIDGDRAIVYVSFWNNYSGLIVSEHPIRRIGNTVAFGQPNHHVIFKYRCPICF